MRDLHLDLQAVGGAATRSALVALGHTHRTLRSAVLEKEVKAAGRSWLVLPDADPAIAIALKAGGVLGGATALRSYGVWVTRTPTVQIATKPTASRLPASEGDRLWVPFELDAHGWRVCVLDALVQHARAVPRVDAIASIDSAWHQGLIDEEQVDELFRRLPRRFASWQRLLDRNAESGLESLVRVPCMDRGWRVESQVPAPGGGRSDLLLDGWLYVEADGSQWHDNEQQAKKDRQRNAAITAAGRRWLRFGSREILHEIDATMAVIAQLMAEGRPRLAG